MFIFYVSKYLNFYGLYLIESKIWNVRYTKQISVQGISVLCEAMRTPATAQGLCRHHIYVTVTSLQMMREANQWPVLCNLFKKRNTMS